MCARTHVSKSFVLNSRAKGELSKTQGKVTYHWSGKLHVTALVPLKIFPQYFVLVKRRGIAACLWIGQHSPINTTWLLPTTHALFLDVLCWLLTVTLPTGWKEACSFTDIALHLSLLTLKLFPVVTTLASYLLQAPSTTKAETSNGMSCALHISSYPLTSEGA